MSSTHSVEKSVNAPRSVVVGIASDLCGSPADPFEHGNTENLHVDRLVKAGEPVAMTGERELDCLCLVEDARPDRIVWRRTVGSQPGWVTTESFEQLDEGRTLVRIDTELLAPESSLWEEPAWPWRMLEWTAESRLAHLVRRAERLATNLAPEAFSPDEFLVELIERADPIVLERIATVDNGHGAQEVRSFLQSWERGKPTLRPLSWQEGESLSLMALARFEKDDAPEDLGQLAYAKLVACGLYLRYAAEPRMGGCELASENLHAQLFEAAVLVSPELARKAADLLLWVGSREFVPCEERRVHQLITGLWILARCTDVPDSRLKDLQQRCTLLAQLAATEWPRCPDPVASQRIAKLGDVPPA